VKVAKPAKITDSLITAQSKARIPMMTARIPVKKKLGMIVMAGSHPAMAPAFR